MTSLRPTCEEVHLYTRFRIILSNQAQCLCNNHIMSRFLATGRFFLRQFTVPLNSRPSFTHKFRSCRRPFSSSTNFHLHPRTRLLLASSPLPPAAFVALSQGDNDDGKTGEERMLETSRAELEEHVPRMLENSNKWRRRIYFLIDIYIWEPICTTLRFFHLFVIFMPVILTVPAIWMGRRIRDRDNERTGTLWWYGYLVWSMERAGAAYIKVGSLMTER
jgi:aarF domain-containing kinase